MERPNRVLGLFADRRGAVTLEYLLVVMAVGLTTAGALLAVLPNVHRAELGQLRALYGSTP
ncbi:MAG: hypothetical protein QM784_21505 [Polyangiaceae bacterium]